MLACLSGYNRQVDCNHTHTTQSVRTYRVLREDIDLQRVKATETKCVDCGKVISVVPHGHIPDEQMPGTAAIHLVPEDEA
jgi:hypothetical protein